MWTVLILCFVQFIALIIGFISYKKKYRHKNMVLFNAIVIIILILLAALREYGLDPDYEGYVESYNDNIEYGKEVTFNIIKRIGHFFSLDSLFLFFAYASISIPLKYFAILKFSPKPIFSFCIWITFSFILHDMIQIRAAVATGLFLWFIPAVVEKKYVASIIILIIAFFFHTSAIIMVLLYPLSTKTLNKSFWFGIYILAWLFNMNIINPYAMIDILIGFLPSYVSSRINGAGSSFEYLSSLNHLTLYSRFILIPTIVTIVSLFKWETLNKRYSCSVLLIKTNIIALLIWSINIPVTSVRLTEFLFVSLIYLIPMSIFWFKTKQKYMVGAIVVSICCLFFTWNELVKQDVFNLFNTRI